MEPREYKTKPYVLRAKKKYDEKNRREGRYKCEKCDLCCASSTELSKHQLTKSHYDPQVAELDKKYKHVCEGCGYGTNFAQCYHRHLKTDKHIRIYRVEVPKAIGDFPELPNENLSILCI